ncbi:MAG: D-alanine--D-alanine ligase [Gammaproteobacteria bacterium]|nr:D-alanine--D-alanine ligase [Gammaproteobacteria bacterium]
MSETFGRVAVLMGGQSAEREISLLSGKAVLDALLANDIDAVGIDTGNDFFSAINKEKFDRAFIMLHGSFGEDGRVQAALDLMGIPYTGSGHMASALAMDKVRSKLIWMAQGLPTPEFEILYDSSDWQAVLDRLGPCFVKPVRDGSSLGISKAETTDELKQAYELASKYDAAVMAESLIDGPEYSVPIVGNQVLPAIELRTKNAFYDYEAKYISDQTEYLCPCDLEEEADQELRGISGEAYQLIGCEGWGRVDLMRDKKGKFWLLELNTIPGMTSHSLVPMSAKVVGMDFKQLVLEILLNSMQEQGGSES